MTEKEKQEQGLPYYGLDPEVLKGLLYQQLLMQLHLLATL